MFDFIKIFLIVTLGAICISSQVIASTVNSIEIKPSLNNFDVIVNSSENIKTQKNIKHGKMIFTLKNTKPSSDFALKYDSTDLDNVLVKTTKNDTKIILKSNKIFPPLKNNNYCIYYILGTITVGFLFVKLIGNDREKPGNAFQPYNTGNVDFLLQYKLNKKEEQKTKIAA